jgi:hypothetical protein
MTAYNETCAAIGNDFWNQRLFLLHADARYIDVMERTLYNGLISGVSLDGKSFFYPNPLESNGQHARSPWFGVACCPGNITRFLASVPGYVYALRPMSGRPARPASRATPTGSAPGSSRLDTLYVNLFASGRADIDMGGGRAARVTQATRYPWDGAVRMTIDPAPSREFTLNVRIPGWARNEPVPGDLYRFLDRSPDAVTLKVNGTPVNLALDRGYASITRTWRRGDVVELVLPMPVRRVVANEQVEADRGRVALQRGPIVYAAEWPDNPNGRVRNLVLPDAAALSSEFKTDLLNGVQVVKARAVGLALDAQGKVVRTDQEFTAIPYATWANRGRGQMIVWLPRTEAVARPAPWPTVATTGTVTTSGRKNPRAINDGEEPSSSDDPTAYFDWWPTKGTTEWVEMTLAKPSSVSEVEVYWFDDTGRGEVRVPQSWRILCKSGDEWKPVAASGAYGVRKDAYNRVTFMPVTTAALRLEVTMQPGWSAGLQEWKVR